MHPDVDPPEKSSSAEALVGVTAVSSRGLCSQPQVGLPAARHGGGLTDEMTGSRLLSCEVDGPALLSRAGDGGVVTGQTIGRHVEDDLQGTVDWIGGSRTEQ